VSKIQDLFIDISQPVRGPEPISHAEDAKPTASRTASFNYIHTTHRRGGKPTRIHAKSTITHYHHTRRRCEKEEAKEKEVKKPPRISEVGRGD
jgi:hypothetical protein